MIPHTLSHYFEDNQPVAFAFCAQGLIPRAVLDAYAARKVPRSLSADEEDAHSATSGSSSRQGEWLRSPPGEGERLEPSDYQFQPGAKRSRRRNSKKWLRHNPMRGNRHGQPGYSPVLSNTSALTSEDIEGWLLDVSAAAGAAP